MMNEGVTTKALILLLLTAVMVGCGAVDLPSAKSVDAPSLAAEESHSIEPLVTIRTKNFLERNIDQMFALRVAKTNSELGFEVYEGAEIIVECQILGATKKELGDQIEERIRDALNQGEIIDSLVIHASGEVLAGQVEFVKDAIKAAEMGSEILIYIYFNTSS